MPGRPPGPAVSRGRRRRWPDAAVAIVRVLAGNATVAWLAHKGLLAPELAAIAVGVTAVPGVVGLLRRRNPGHR